MSNVLVQAQQILKGANYSCIRKLTVDINNGDLILSGEVRTYHMKQVAISILSKIGCQIDAKELLVKAKE